MKNKLISSEWNQSADVFFRIAVLIISGLVLPLILVLLVKFTGFSEILEEISKALIVALLILKLFSLRQKIIAGVLFGFLFGLSENLLYLNNIFKLGDFNIFWQRFLWTTPMHIITVLVILFSGLAGKRFLIFGLAGAIILHALFNGLVGGF